MYRARGRNRRELEQYSMTSCEHEPQYDVPVVQILATGQRSRLLCSLINVCLL